MMTERTTDELVLSTLNFSPIVFPKLQESADFWRRTIVAHAEGLEPLFLSVRANPLQPVMSVSIACSQCGGSTSLQRSDASGLKPGIPACNDCGMIWLGSVARTGAVGATSGHDLFGQEARHIESWFEVAGADPLVAVLCVDSLMDYFRNKILQGKINA